MKNPIVRTRSGNAFVYRVGRRVVHDPQVISYVESLVIPPAWNDVQISQSRRAKVLVRGIDAAGRTQMIYNPAFRRRQERKKFARVQQFGKALPRLRSRVDREQTLKDAGAEAAALLGNTTAVTKSSYVHPDVLRSVHHPRTLINIARSRVRVHDHLSTQEARTLKLLKAMLRKR